MPHCQDLRPTPRGYRDCPEPAIVRRTITQHYPTGGEDTFAIHLCREHADRHAANQADSIVRYEFEDEPLPVAD